MKYTCPNCAFGKLQPAKVTYLRYWNEQIVTIPDFAAWRCDSCSYTRYDVAELAKLDTLLGPDEQSLFEPHPRRVRPAEGPGERGPRRWSS